jgi:hypothetical protein
MVLKRQILSLLIVSVLLSACSLSNELSNKMAHGDISATSIRAFHVYCLPLDGTIDLRDFNATANMRYLVVTDTATISQTVSELFIGPSIESYDGGQKELRGRIVFYLGDGQSDYIQYYLLKRAGDAVVMPRTTIFDYDPLKLPKGGAFTLRNLTESACASYPPSKEK